MLLYRLGPEGFWAAGEDAASLRVLYSDPLEVAPAAWTFGKDVDSSQLHPLSPVAPRKIVGIGRNYRDHAAELGNDVPASPMLFFKPNTSVVGPGDAVVLPRHSEFVSYEGELAAVIGRIAKNVPASRALDHVFGYTIANDLTARDWQKTDGQWARAKGFDTSCPLGPAIETDFDVAGAAVITTRLNGEVRQQGPISDMIFSLAEIIEFASAAFTLLPGDVILTGTPAGVGQITAGDTVEVEITGLGTLRNTARAA